MNIDKIIIDISILYNTKIYLKLASSNIHLEKTYMLPNEILLHDVIKFNLKNHIKERNYIS